MNASLERGGNGVSISNETDPIPDLMTRPDAIVEDTLVERSKAIVGRYSVKTKILGIVLTLTTILGLGITWQVRDATRDLTESELLDRGGGIAAGVAAQVAEPLMGGDNESVLEVLDGMLAAHLDTVFINVSRPDGVIIATAAVAGSLPAGSLPAGPLDEALEGKDDVHTLLVDREGQILRRTVGRYDSDKADELRKVMATNVSDPS